VMNGYQTARWLGQHHPDVRIIAVSIIANPEAVEGMLRSGAHGFLPKGSAAQAVYESVREVAAEGVLYNAYVSSETMAAAATGRGREALTDRQLELLHCCDSDDTFEAIADKMHLSVHTAKRYASELYRFFGVHSRAAVLHEARRLGLLPVDKS